MISTAPKQTAFGDAAQIRALGGDKLTFTCFKIGNGELSDTDPYELTDLINPLLVIPIKEIDKSNKGYVKVIGEFNSSDIQSDFRWTELGLFCTVNDGAEGVHSYGNDGSNAGMLKANVSEVVADTRIALIIEIGNAENVTAIISESVLYARKTDFDNHVSDNENPHGVTKEQIGLGEVPNVKTNDQKPTFSVASSLTELTSGETLSVSFGKIARAIKSLISHLNNKSNPHGITASAISAAKAEHNHSAANINSGVLGVARGGTGVTSLAELFKNAELTGSPKAPTAARGSSSKEIATTAFVQNELSDLYNKIKALSGNAYLGKVVASLTVEIYRICNAGHSEYTYYKIRCIGCKLPSGGDVSNNEGKYIQYGNGTYGVNNFVIGFDPDLVVSTPINNVTLDNCLYVGEAKSGYKTINISNVDNWSDEREENAGYVEYSRAIVTIQNS